MLHYLDDLDSKMEAMRAHFEREAEMEGPWTTYNSSLGRTLLNSEKFLRPETPAHEEPAAPAPAETAKPAAEETVVQAASVTVSLFSEEKA